MSQTKEIGSGQHAALARAKGRIDSILDSAPGKDRIARSDRIIWLVHACDAKLENSEQ